MFYLDSGNNLYYIGQSFTYNNTAYPGHVATHDKFIELGFTQVEVQTRPDDAYYFVTGPDLTGSYSTTPRNLAELKTQFKLQQKQQSHLILRQTDWYIIRSDELGAATASVPTAVLEFRAAYRTASDTRCAQIDACQSVEELETLIKGESLTAWPEQLAEAYNYYS